MYCIVNMVQQIWMQATLAFGCVEVRSCSYIRVRAQALITFGVRPYDAIATTFVSERDDGGIR